MTSNTINWKIMIEIDDDGGELLVSYLFPEYTQKVKDSQEFSEAGDALQKRLSEALKSGKISKERLAQREQEWAESVACDQPDPLLAMEWLHSALTRLVNRSDVASLDIPAFREALSLEKQEGHLPPPYHFKVSIGRQLDLALFIAREEATKNGEASVSMEQMESALQRAERNEIILHGSGLLKGFRYYPQAFGLRFGEEDK